MLIDKEAICTKERLKEERVLFKIDLEEAYDHLDWDFLSYICRMRFGCKWRGTEEGMCFFNFILGVDKWISYEFVYRHKSVEARRPFIPLFRLQ